MTGLLELRENLKRFYTKNEIYLNPLIKFLAALLSLIIINQAMGYMGMLKSFAIIMVLSLMCSFLPGNFIVVISALYIVLHSYALALECAVVVMAVMLIMFLIYFRFSPKDTMVVLLTPILFILKIPFVMPVALGLVAGPASIISLSCGTVIYYIIKFMTDNLGIFSAADAETGSQKFRVMMDGVLDNKTMLITVIIFAFTLIAVYMIRRTSADHSWTMAIFTGISVSVVLLLICEFLFELQLSVVGTVIGGVFSLLLCLVIQFFEFNVDYTRTELVQFEDDEYYYYVKAVPKNMVTAQEKKVKRINRKPRNGAVKPSKKQAVPRASVAGGQKPGGRQERPLEKRVNPKVIKTANGVARTTENRE